MEQIYTAIQAAAEQDAARFRDAIGAALGAKIEDALELKKIEIASTMFAPQQQEEELSAEQEIETDEDIQTTA
jgi:hypothetical protein